VNVAFYGKDVYIQGVCSAADDTWIKGTKVAEEGDNVYTFANGQVIGVDENTGALLFLMGFDGVGVTDVTMTFDPQTNSLTTNLILIENKAYTDLINYSNVVLSGATFTIDNPDAIATVEAKAETNAVRYNIAGQRVGKSYKGLVVEKGQKFLQK
jgi:hypothetical protein